jgi:hypothetical protein
MGDDRLCEDSKQAGQKKAVKKLPNPLIYGPTGTRAGSLLGRNVIFTGSIAFAKWDFPLYITGRIEYLRLGLRTALT